MSDHETHPLRLEITRNGEEATVLCFGKLVGANATDLYDQVRPLMPAARRVTLDLCHLDYADSMGLGSLVRLYVSARSSGSELILINLGKRVRALLGVTGLLSVFATMGEQGIHLKY